MVLAYDLIGEFDVSLDSKGRFRIPGGLLKDMGNRDELEFVINRGYYDNLVMYPKGVWDQQMAKLDARLDEFNPAHRRYRMLYQRGANKVSPDSADRILLPKRLQGYAEGEKSLILSANQDHIDIWTEAKYDAFALGETTSQVVELAASIFGGSATVPPVSPQ